jgi:hypothetical protein
VCVGACVSVIANLVCAGHLWPVLMGKPNLEYFAVASVTQLRTTSQLFTTDPDMRWCVGCCLYIWALRA